MNIETKLIEFKTKGFTDIIDLTPSIRKELAQTGFTEGQVCVFGIGSTTGISTIEYEPGLVKSDVAEMFESFASYRIKYKHNQTWGDDNGAAHLRSTVMGTSKNIPFMNGELILGTWQQVVFIDFDTRPRSRRVVLQFLGV